MWAKEGTSSGEAGKYNFLHNVFQKLPECGVPPQKFSPQLVGISLYYIYFYDIIFRLFLKYIKMKLIIEDLFSIYIDRFKLKI